MNIAIIIFVISVIVTIVSAISDNSHKDRKNQKPPINNQPNRNGEQPKRGGFLDEIGKAFKEIEQQMNEGPTRKDIEQQPQKLQNLQDQLKLELKKWNRLILNNRLEQCVQTTRLKQKN